MNRNSCHVVIAALGLLLTSCGGGGSGGGGVHLEIRNETSDAVLSRAEFQDLLSGEVVASADFAIPPGGTWEGDLDIPVGSYWRVVRGNEVDTGALCEQDDRDLGVTEDIGPDDHSLIWIFRGFFCDPGDFDF